MPQNEVNRRHPGSSTGGRAPSHPCLLFPDILLAQDPPKPHRGLVPPNPPHLPLVGQDGSAPAMLRPKGQQGETTWGVREAAKVQELAARD